MRFWILLLMLMLHHSGAYPADKHNSEVDNDETKKVIGSSVVTSVSVILNGDEPQFTDAVGKPIPKPMLPLQVASPINLLNPDRYEFYTFDDNGELIKRLMTLEEIQSIVANGDVESGAIVHSIPINNRDPEKNIRDIVQNVQNVLTREVEWKKNTSNDRPVLDTPDVSSSWSMILPAIFGNTGDDVFPNRPHQVVMTPDTDVVENSSKAPVTTSQNLKPPHKAKPPKPSRKPTRKPTRKTTTVAPTTHAQTSAAPTTSDPTTPTPTTPAPTTPTPSTPSPSTPDPTTPTPSTPDTTTPTTPTPTTPTPTTPTPTTADTTTTTPTTPTPMTDNVIYEEIKTVTPSATPEPLAVKPIFNRLDLMSVKKTPPPVTNEDDSTIYTISSMIPVLETLTTSKPQTSTTLEATTTKTTPTERVTIKILTTSLPTTTTTPAPTTSATTTTTTTQKPTTTSRQTTTTPTPTTPTPTTPTPTSTTKTVAPDTTTTESFDDSSTSVEESSTLYRNEDITTFDGSNEDSATQSIHEILTSLSDDEADMNAKLSFDQILESLKLDEHTERRTESTEIKAQTTVQDEEPSKETPQVQEATTVKLTTTHAPPKTTRPAKPVESSEPASHTVMFEPNYVELRDPILKDLPTTTEDIVSDATTILDNEDVTEEIPEQAALTKVEEAQELKEKESSSVEENLKFGAHPDFIPVPIVKPPSKLAQEIDRFIEENLKKAQIPEADMKDTMSIPDMDEDQKMSDFQNQVATVASNIVDDAVKHVQKGELKLDVEPVLDIQSLMSDIMNQMTDSPSSTIAGGLEEDEVLKDETSHRHSNIAKISAAVLGETVKDKEEMATTAADRLEETTVAEQESRESVESEESAESKEDVSFETSVVKETSSVSMEVNHSAEVEDEKDNFIKISVTPSPTTSQPESLSTTAQEEEQRTTVENTPEDFTTPELKTTTSLPEESFTTTTANSQVNNTSSSEESLFVPVEIITNSPTTTSTVSEDLDETSTIAEEQATTEVDSTTIDLESTADTTETPTEKTVYTTQTQPETTTDMLDEDTTPAIGKEQETTTVEDATTTGLPIIPFPESMERHRVPLNYTNNSEKRVTSPVEAPYDFSDSERPFIKLGEATTSTAASPLNMPKPGYPGNENKFTQYNNQRPMVRPPALSNLKVNQVNHVTRPPVKLDPTPEQSLGLEASTLYLDDDVQEFAKLCNELAFNYWTSITSDKISPSRSLVLSPFAVTSMLSMVFLGARGSTSGEMNEILRLDDMVTFNPHLVFKNITESVEGTRDPDVDSAAFVREIFTDRANGKVLQFFKEKTQQLYGGHVEEVNFNVVNDIVRRRTNLLVKRHTMGKIMEYLRTNNVWVTGPLATVAANLFQTDCSRGTTHDRDGEMFFQVHPSVRQRRLVPIPAVVFRTGFSAGYDPQLDATLVAFGAPYETVSTIYMMPGQQGMAAPGDNLERLEASLMTTAISSNAWSRILMTVMERPGLEVQLPRFSHRSFVNASLGLQRMGLKVLFNSESADLRGLTGSSQRDVFLSDMIQINTFSTCAEDKIADHHHVEMYPAPPLRRRIASKDGSETVQDDFSIQDNGRAYYDDLLDPKYLELPLPLRPRQARIPDAPRLRFDKPFLFFVRHNPTGIILFMGRFNPRLLP